MSAQMMITDRMPNRAAIKRAAYVEAQLTALRAQGINPPPTLVREAQHALATFNQLNDFEKAIVQQTFNADVAHLVESVHVEAETRQAEAFQAKSDNMLKELTKGMGDRPEGLNMELARALRSGGQVKVKVPRIASGAEANARMKAATGVTFTQYSKHMDELLSQRKMYRYNDEPRYRAAIEKALPGVSFRDADRQIKAWEMERVGIAMKQNADRDKPAERALRPLDASESLRLDIIESLAESEGKNPRSPFHKDQRDRLQEIAAERGDRTDDLRSDIALAFLAHGGTLDVDVGPIRDDASDDITNIEGEE